MPKGDDRFMEWVRAAHARTSFSQSSGGVISLDEYRVRELFEKAYPLKPASPQGEWTREAPTEAGWYWVNFHDHPSDKSTLWRFESGQNLYGDALVRWSLAAPMPPPPTEGSGT